MFARLRERVRKGLQFKADLPQFWHMTRPLQPARNQAIPGEYE